MGIQAGEVVSRNQAARLLKKKVQKAGKADIIKWGTSAWKKAWDECFANTGNDDGNGRRTYRVREGAGLA